MIFPNPILVHIPIIHNYAIPQPLHVFFSLFSQNIITTSLVLTILEVMWSSAYVASLLLNLCFPFNIVLTATHFIEIKFIGILVLATY